MNDQTPAQIVINPSDFYFCYINNRDTCLHGSICIVEKEFWETNKHLNGNTIPGLIGFLRSYGFGEVCENAFKWSTPESRAVWNSNIPYEDKCDYVEKVSERERGKSGCKILADLGMTENKEINKSV
jgi:hypothetical protein